MNVKQMAEALDVAECTISIGGTDTANPSLTPVPDGKGDNLKRPWKSSVLFAITVTEVLTQRM